MWSKRRYSDERVQAGVDDVSATSRLTSMGLGGVTMAEGEPYFYIFFRMNENEKDKKVAGDGV